MHIIFFNRDLSYFAKPNFIVYDEWFDDDLKNNKLDFKNKKIKNITNIHEFFYKQSNYKVGGSEKKLQFDIKVNEKKLLSNNFLEKNSRKYKSLSIKNFWFFEKLTKSKLKFKITKKIIYYLSIFGFLFIFGFLILFISQSKKNQSELTYKSFVLEKEFLFSKRIR